MTGGIEEYAKRGARLVFCPSRAEFEHDLFSSIEVVDHDVHMHLLGDVLSRPIGGRNCSTRWKQMHWSPAALRTSPHPSSELAFQSSKVP